MTGSGCVPGLPGDAVRGRCRVPLVVAVPPAPPLPPAVVPSPPSPPVALAAEPLLMISTLPLAAAAAARRRRCRWYRSRRRRPDRRPTSHSCRNAPPLPPVAACSAFAAGPRTPRRRRCAFPVPSGERVATGHWCTVLRHTHRVGRCRRPDHPSKSSRDVSTNADRSPSATAHFAKTAA